MNTQCLSFGRDVARGWRLEGWWFFGWREGYGVELVIEMRERVCLWEGDCCEVCV